MRNWDSQVDGFREAGYTEARSDLLFEALLSPGNPRDQEYLRIIGNCGFVEVGTGDEPVADPRHGIRVRVL
jgi:hypothetical protein